MVRTQLSRLKPITLVVYSTPGVLASMSLDLALAASSVRCSEAALGSCRFTYRYPWSSSGRKLEGSLATEECRARLPQATSKTNAIALLRMSAPAPADVAVGCARRRRG